MTYAARSGELPSLAVLAVIAAVTSAADSGGLLDASCLTSPACFVLPARLSFASPFSCDWAALWGLLKSVLDADDSFAAGDLVTPEARGLRPGKLLSFAY